MKCSKCPAEARPKQRYCLACAAAWLREYRSRTPLTPLQRKKSNARAYARVYVGRGKLPRKPCEVCGDPAAERHLADYDRPLEVRWLCRRHRLALRAALR